MKARTVARASGWAAAGLAASKGVTLATTVVLAHFLAPADFGLVALAAVATDLVQLVQDLGLSPALVQHRGDARAAAAVALRLHLGAAVALTLAVELAAGPIARGLGEPALVPLLRVLALGTLARGVALVPRALLQRALAFRALALADVTALVARGVVATVLAWRDAGVWSLVAGDLTALAVQGAVVWAVHGAVPLAAPAPALRATLLRFGRPMTVASLVVWARDGVTRTLVGTLLGPAELGWFHLATRIAGMPVVGITHVSNRVALPIYAATHDRPALAHAFLTTLTVVGALAMPLAAVLLAVAPSAVAVAFGPAWLPAVRPLRILLVSSMLGALAATTGELFKALGRPQDLLRTALPHLGLLALAVPLAAPYGLAAVAVAIVGVRVAMALLALGIATRLLRLSAADLARAVAPAVAVAVLGLVAARAVGLLGLEEAAGPARVLVLRTAAASAAVGIGLALAWRRYRRETRRTRPSGDASCVSGDAG